MGKSGLVAAGISCLLALGTQASATGAYDMPATILKKPASGFVNVRQWANTTSRIVGKVRNGDRVMILGGSCVKSTNEAEVDMTRYKTKASLYKALKAPNVFCQITTSAYDGWIRGTHLMPDGGFD